MKTKKLADCRASSLVEVMVAVVFFAIVGLALTQSVLGGIRFQKQAEIIMLAKNLAISKAEQLSGVSTTLLNDTYDLTENNLTVTGHTITFTRVTNVTVNSDGSVTVDVSVSSLNPILTNAVSFTTRFAPWET